MRLLVTCPQCQRQYDAGRRPVGARFRCHCGSEVTIHQPKGHDAAVVRCSSCGAPREAGLAACSYCGADFTVHEQDLDTVCPQCFARVSDRARFCHHCGTALRSEALADDVSEMVCPACGKGHRLSHRQVGAVALLECSHCAGFWLGAHVLDDLIAKAAQHAALDDFRVHGRPAPSASAPQSGPMYRPCPVCAGRMNRNNYAYRSGVIIDVCRAHGVWFDADELARILEWVRDGGKAEADRQVAAETEHKAKLDAIARQARRERDIAHGYVGAANASASSGDAWLHVITQLFLPWWLQ
jgi:Zn-finger nucleic acid-binding protein